MPTKHRNDFRHIAMDKLLALGKRLFVSRTPAPDKNSRHRASILSEPVDFKRPFLRLKIFSNHRALLSTQHDRVVISRAARVGLTVKEYEVKYG